MKKIIVILLCATAAFAGRTSQWSDFFTLKEPALTKLAAARLSAANRFDLVVRSRPFGGSVQFLVSGVAAGPAPSLRVFAADGRMVADLSRTVREGWSSVVWNPPAGVFFARLQSAGRLKTVKVVVAR